MNRQPLVSCICPTYGRAPQSLHLLQECVYWFTRQTYPNRELVILNDAEYQTVVCPTPGVRVVNEKQKYKTLGEKYDALVSQARGEIIVPWEDDDISLPMRLEQAVSKLQDADYFNPQHTWYQQGGELHHKHTHGVCHNASAYRKPLWELLGGYGQCTGNQDAVFDGKTFVSPEVRRAGPVVDPCGWMYVYRWGVSPYHLSGFRDMDRAYRDIHAVPCVVFVEPKMGRDYEAETTAILRGISGVGTCRCGRGGQCVNGCGR